MSGGEVARTQARFLRRIRRTPSGARAVACAALLASTLATRPVAAQLDVSGYALGMASRSGRSIWSRAGTTLLGRSRLMAAWTGGPLELDAAYEHVATRSAGGASTGLATPGAGGVGDWLGAEWVIARSSDAEWRHRFDRLSVRWSSESVQVTVGRQAISWATTLFLTPADPFVPFDPSDPFRVYRAGVDAVRVAVFPGPFTELEAVVRPTETSYGTTTTALARAQTSVGGWAVGVWGGALHDEGAAAAFATGAVGATAVRAELSARADPDGGATVRGTLGVDRYFTPGGQDLYLVGEVQYDGFGARSAAALATVAASRPFARGDMQTLGRWALAAQASYQVHPLVALDAVALVNAGDGSVLLAPGASWSATSAASVRLGVFAGVGAETLPSPIPAPPSLPGSEYGPVPPIGYLSLTWFF